MSLSTITRQKIAARQAAHQERVRRAFALLEAVERGLITTAPAVGVPSVVSGR